MKRFLALATLLLACAGIARGESRVGAALSPLEVQVGERAVLTITVEGGGSVEGEPRWSLPEGLSVRSAGESRNFTMINGKFSQSTERRYLITPLRPGRFEIPAFDVRVSGRAYTLGPWTLTAAADSGTPAPGPSPTPGATKGSPPSSPAPSGEAPVRVEMTVEPQNLFVGQQAILSIRFLQRADVTVYDARFIPPETEGFWKEDMPQIPRGVERRAGASYDVTEIRMALFPTRPGRLEISPARVRVQYRMVRRDPFSLFGFSGPDREEEPASGVCAVSVKPLPEPAPDGFTGAVGSFEAKVSLDRPQGVQGEPLNWTVEIAGQGNIAALKGPVFPEIPGCRGLDGGESVDRSRDTRAVGGVKRITRILIPDRAGAVRIPDMEWAYFDPAARRYERLDLPGRSLAVAPASDAPAVGAQAHRIGGGLRPIFSRTRLHPMAAERPWTAPVYFAAAAVPVAALGFAWTVRRRRESERLDPEGARIRRAPARLRRSLALASQDAADPWGSLARGLEDYLIAQFGPEVRGLTRPALRRRLVEMGGEAGAAERIAAVLERADANRYLPSGRRDAKEFEEALRVAAESAGSLKRGRRE